MSRLDRRRPFNTLSLAAAAIVALAACGGDSGPSEPEPDAPSRLLIELIGADQAGEPFDVTVTLADASGAPVVAEAATTIALSVEAGKGALAGTTTGQVAAGSSQVTLTDVTYDHAGETLQLQAAASGGSGSGLSATSQGVELDFDFDAEVIAFRRDDGTQLDVYLMTADGSAFINLTDDPGIDSDPAWSPDGDRLAFVSDRAGNVDLWIMNPDGSGLTQVTANQGSVRFPQWSPDGTRIAYSATVGDQQDLYAIAAPSPPTPSADSGLPKGSTVFAQAEPPVQITDDPGVDNEPVWSPDGSEIFFFSNRDGEGAVWSIDFDGTVGSNPARLTLDFVFACAPGSGFSLADGRVKLSFVGETDGQLDIWTMDLDGSNQTQVTSDQGDEFYSSWMNGSPSPVSPGPEAQSASGSRLVYDSDRTGTWQLFAINEDGSDEVRLTNYDADDEMPRWRAARD